MASEALVKAVTATAEVMGTELSIDGARMFCADLSEYQEAVVLAALTRCRREVTGKLTLAAVIARIDDGRPGPDEAWAMIPRTEAETVVWTDEMAEAWGVAHPLLLAGDAVAARMTFREAYTRIVTKARSERKNASWFASLGTDKTGREGPIREAITKGRIGHAHGMSLLPPPEIGSRNELSPVIERAAAGLSATKRDKEATA